MKLSLKLPKTIDWFLYILPIILVATGIVVIYSLTYYNNTIYLTYNQIIYASIGLALMIFFTFFDYRNFKALSIYLYIFGITLLAIVLFFGKTSLGATRWIDLGIFQLQPSELFKICIIIFLSKLFCDKVGEVKFKDLAVAIVFVILPTILVFIQPDFGTVTVILASSAILVMSLKLKSKQIIAIIIAIIIALPIGWFSLKDYQKQRIETFLNSKSDPFGSGYNVRQSIIAVGSGGLLGRGLGHGPQSQLNFLPIAHTDFIFAGLAEASGFVGSSTFILLVIFLISRIIRVAQISKDNFGMLLAIGFGAMFAYQNFVNISMNLGLLPVTGIPLPFVSSGGTSLIINFIIIGILQSIYLRHKKITF